MGTLIQTHDSFHPLIHSTVGKKKKEKKNAPPFSLESTYNALSQRCIDAADALEMCHTSIVHAALRISISLQHDQWKAATGNKHDQHVIYASLLNNDKMQTTF